MVIISGNKSEIKNMPKTPQCYIDWLEFLPEGWVWADRRPNFEPISFVNVEEMIAALKPRIPSVIWDKCLEHLIELGHYFDEICFWERPCWIGPMPSESSKQEFNEDYVAKKDYYFFYGHKGPIEKACFSQWFIRDFQVEGQTYCCAEQYMMAKKASLFLDKETHEKIMQSTSPKEIKALGRQVKGFDSFWWDVHKKRIVREGNLAKFSQNPDLKEYLLSTGDKILVEASPWDKVWGIGLRASDPRAQQRITWLGTNFLGFILTDVKKALRSEES